MKTENSSSKAMGSGVPEWWHVLSSEEKQVIRDVLRSIRGLKRSRSPEVAKVARKWERSIACFIKFRLMSGAKRRPKQYSGETPKQTRETRVLPTAGPASSRSLRGVSPSRD